MPILLESSPYGANKTSHLLRNYARHFGPLVNREVRLLELGIASGGSLKLWADYFPRGVIVGLDCAHLELPTDGRITIYEGRQEDTGLLDRIACTHAPDGFDIVIDDASHVGAFTRISFWHLFERHLKPGGIYAIEDWGTGYWASWPDGRRCDIAPGSPLGEAPCQQDGKMRDFPSHTAGVVGVIKELIDEVGMGELSRSTPESHGTRGSRIARLEILPGLVVAIRA